MVRCETERVQVYGQDGVHLRALKKLAAEPLSIIFEKSWLSGEVPDAWRKGHVTAVGKKGSKEDTGTTGR